MYLKDCRIWVTGEARVDAYCTPCKPIRRLVRSERVLLQLEFPVPILWSPKPSFPLKGTEELARAGLASGGAWLLVRR